KTISSTKDAFACLDELTSSPPGTHFGLINIGQDTKQFFNMSIYSKSTISLANAVHNFAQIMNSIALGAKDGSTAALDKLDDIRNKLVPEHSQSDDKVMRIFWIIIKAFAMLLVMAATDGLGAALFGEEAAAGITAEEVAQGAVLVERGSIAFSRGFFKIALSVLDFAREATKKEPEEPDSKPEEWLNLAKQSI
ncbi:3032_t:CDS:1, partial [Gigaspora rosea]